MLLISRHRCLALLLIMVVSNMAFSAHVATHTADDLNTCELCTGHGDPSHAIPLSPVTLAAAAPVYFEIELTRETRPASILVHFRQRAPPASPD